MRSRAAAVLVALVVYDAIHRGPAAYSPAWCDGLAQVFERPDPALASGLQKMPGWIGGTPAAVSGEITRWSRPPLGFAHGFGGWHGISPFATSSVLYALFAYLRAPTDPEGVLHVAVGVGGLTPRLARWAQHLKDQGTFGRDELVAIARTVQ